jgi:ribosomal protein S18 acetylase RimI-like enzyme
VEAARAATAEDIPAMVDLARALRAELRGMRGGALWELRDARAEPFDEAFRGLLARQDACLVVGTIDAAVIGYAAVELETLRDGTRLGVITELFVDPEARGVGVGEAIAVQLVSYCTREGCIGIDAGALPGHRDTKNFFERTGFTARSLTMHKRL